MARPIRIEFPGAIYHIYARGNRQEHIFLDDKDRILFLKLLADNAKKLNWLCHAYCLMGNHYHLLLETPDGILSSGMQIINSVYAKRFNRKYDQVGHLFQGRYSDRLVEGDVDLLLTARYICRNPIEANFVQDAAHWKWCSYKPTIGKGRSPEFLTTTQILNCLSMNHSKAREFFRCFVHADIGKNGEGMLEFIQEKSVEYFLSSKLSPIIDMKRSNGPVQRTQRILSRPSLEELFSRIDPFEPEQRNGVIRDAYRFYGYKQTEIALFLGLDRSTIIKIVKTTN